MKSYEISVKYHTKKQPKKAVTCSTDVFDMIKTWFDDCMEHRERFIAVSLNRANKIIGIQNIGEGGTASCVVDKKIVAQGAILSNASAVILAHNHPSGNLKPSNADKKITKDIKEGLSLFDIQVLDHLIITEESFYSFADEGIL
jgi:DNA repair protein RadC